MTPFWIIWLILYLFYLVGGGYTYTRQEGYVIYGRHFGLVILLGLLAWKVWNH